MRPTPVVAPPIWIAKACGKLPVAWAESVPALTVVPLAIPAPAAGAVNSMPTAPEGVAEAGVKPDSAVTIPVFEFRMVPKLPAMASSRIAVVVNGPPKPPELNGPKIPGRTVMDPLLTMPADEPVKVVALTHIPSIDGRKKPANWGKPGAMRAAVIVPLLTTCPLRDDWVTSTPLKGSWKAAGIPWARLKAAIWACTAAGAAPIPRLLVTVSPWGTMMLPAVTWTYPAQVRTGN